MAAPGRADERLTPPDLTEAGDGPGAAATTPTLPWWVGPTAVLAGGAGWIALRPSTPVGVAAVADLLVLPAILFAEVRLLAGRRALSWSRLAVAFGLGAVLATLVALLLEGLATQALVPSRAGALGSVVEVLALGMPVAVLAVIGPRDDRPHGVVDLGLAGLASGLGFLVVQTSLITAAGHVAPRYVSPLVAGWQQLSVVAGEVRHFVGPPVAGALLGMATALAVRWWTWPWRLVPPVLVLCVLVIDRALFDRELRHAVTGEIPAAGWAVDLLQQVTVSGRIELALVALGLLLFGPVGPLQAQARRPRPEPPGDHEDGHDEDGHAGEGEPVDEREPAVDRDDSAEPEDAARPAPDDGAGSSAAPPHPPAPLPLWLSLAGAVGAGIAFVALARSRHLGLLQDRGVALGIAVAGLGYGSLRLARLRAPAWTPADEGASDEETDPRRDPTAEDPAADLDDVTVVPTLDLTQVLCLSAMAASATGIACALLPAPVAIRPLHGALLYDGARAWAAHVGNLGFLLGIAGLAATPPGPIAPASAGGWRDVLPWRIRSSSWWHGLAPRGRRLGRGGSWRLGSARVGGGGAGSGGSLPWWRPAWRRHGGAPGGAGGLLGGGSTGRLRWRGGRWRPVPLPDEPEEQHHQTVTITIEPVDELRRTRSEFQGATVQEAMQAALHHPDVHLTGASLQLVDEGQPAKPGKPGSGRPARVRVLRDRDAGEALKPPGLQAIARTSSFVVVVDLQAPEAAVPGLAADQAAMAAGTEATGPSSIEVDVHGPSEVHTLTCLREEISPAHTRYRSNPYSVDSGEDRAWVGAGAKAAPGVKIREGQALRVEYRGETAAVTVYDGWAQIVMAVNRSLFDTIAAHHVTALAQCERDDDPAVRDRIEHLRRSLAAAEEGRHLLASRSPADEKAFLSTAILHRAIVGDGADAEDRRAAAVAALREHREALRNNEAGEVAESYRRFLETTIVAKLWTAGATTAEDVGRIIASSRANTQVW